MALRPSKWSGSSSARPLFLAATLAALAGACSGATGAGEGAASRPAAAAAPVSVTIAGSLDPALGCTAAWDPACAAAHLAYDPADGVWQGTWTIPAGAWEYKAALNDSWDENYGLNAAPGGANLPLALAAPTAVKFYFDPATHWITDDQRSLIVTAPGSYQHQLGCGGDWDPGCLRSWLEDPAGTGAYSFETTALLAGTYEAKAALRESWAENYGQGGVRDGANLSFTVPADHARVTFRYDPASHLLTIGAGHGHDGNVEYAGLAHDSRSDLYRVPSGAVAPGTPVTLRLRTFHGDATGVVVRLWDSAVGREDRRPMALAASGADCYDPALAAAGDTCDYWQYVYAPAALGTVYYRFVVSDGAATAYYADDAPRYGGLGRATPTEVDNGFRLNVVAAGTRPVAWMRDGVLYQIFPDRFRNGSRENDPRPTDFRYAYPAPAGATPQQQAAAALAQILPKAWGDLPEGHCRNYVSPAAACTEAPQGRDYFGGDLEGIDDKLDYLRSLGVTVLYLNPIFSSGSNHGYDTRDYLQVSRYFGGNGAFRKLARDAGAHGMRIVLDGVFNHLSSDSPFFDRYHHYTSVGACESLSSPYRSWFVFHDVAAGTGVCVDSMGRPDSATYDAWAGYDSIPVIVKRDPADAERPYAPVRSYFYGGPGGGVAGFWLRAGAAGWRFDVMNDPSFPVAYWQELRTITQGIEPDEVLVAEAWHWWDALPLTHGDQADTAMGYRFRNAVLGLLGAVDDKGFAEETDPNLPPSTFVKRIESIREDCSDATWFTYQNLLDSHDTRRILWSLTPGLENREERELDPANLAAGKKRQAVAALIQMTLPGTPSIYYGDEVGVTGADDPDDRRTFPWTDGSGPSGRKRGFPYFGAGGDHATLDWYRKLVAVRAAVPVLRQGALRFLLADDVNRTVAWALRKDDALAVVVVNRDEANARDVVVPTAGYLRDGVRLVDVLRATSASTGGGQLAVHLAPLSGAILVMAPGQRITGPAAPAGLAATAQNGVASVVHLAWKAAPRAASYQVLRSPVSGGGYVALGTTSATAFDDASVRNGATYHYAVRALDALGNLGARSGEAEATPAFPIGSAVLQWPKTIDQTITASHTTVYGQVYVQGLTDAGGDPSAVLAQLGLGAPGSDPAGWAWSPMVYNVRSGNDYEYMGGLRADAPGTFHYLVRFSDDGGRTWVYGDQDGFHDGNPGTDQPGVLTVAPSADTTAPSAPVAAIDYGPGSLTVSWTASSDPDDAVAEYRVFRGTSAGAEDAAPIAVVSGATLAFEDRDVNAGETYWYRVRAYDGALNASAASNEVSHRVEAKVVQVTFRVKVPAFTPAGDGLYVTGQVGGVTPDPLCAYCGGSPDLRMTQVAPGIWEKTVAIPDGMPIQYKYTRGSYDYVEEWGTIRGFTNRVGAVAANGPADLTQLVDDTSDASPVDDHRAVQNWRDALVTATAPASGSSGAAPAAIAVAFNWDVKPDGTDFTTALAVTAGGAAVAGTITHEPAQQTLTFHPAAPLAPGSYAVTVDHVVPLTPQNDGVRIRTPYVFGFSID